MKSWKTQRNLEKTQRNLEKTQAIMQEKTQKVASSIDLICQRSVQAPDPSAASGDVLFV